VCRRINLFDPMDGLPSDQDLLDRAEKLVEDLPLLTPTPREAFLAALQDDSR
jgi:hypothetical protein